jgi:glycosyltransferase involved in cell wall biosynthesis
MQKALIITPFCYPNVGGAETFSEDLAKALSKKYVVHICTIDWKKPILWQGLPLFKGLKLLLRLNFGYRKMRKRYTYEKVYASGLIGSAVCVLNRVKFNAVILSLYGFKSQNLIIKYILNKADKVFVEGNRCALDMIIAGIDEGKIRRFQHWCDQSRFQYVVRNHKRLKVLFIGRAIKIKGKHIIKGCEKLTTGIDYEYIENVPYKDLPRHYQMADVCVVPSLYSESFSRVVVEAASCGCIIIASNYGSLPEMVTPFGKCIEPTSYNFATELNRLKNNMLGVEALQVKTAYYAKEHFSEKNAEVFL